MPNKTYNSEPEQEVIEFIPHDGQKRVLRSQKRFIFAMGGNRGGKTTIGCYWAYLNMQVPNTRHLIGANTYDQLTHSVLAKFFEIFPQLNKYYIKRDKMLRLPNGTQVYFKSLEIPDLIKGLNLHSAWIDEADGMSEDTWGILRSRFATTGGRCLATSSIYPQSWIYDAVYKKEDPDYEIITWESLVNPDFPQEEWDKLKRETDPIVFAREYESKFMFEAGRVYADVLKYGMIDEFPTGSTPIVWLFGIDYGVNDPTCISVMSYNTDGCWYIVDEYYSPGMSIQDVNHWLRYFMAKYGRPFMTVQDPAGGIARLSLEPLANASDGVKKIIERLSIVRNLIFQRRLFVFNRCVNHIREFSYYQFDRKHPGMPEDKNNHAMDSIGMVIHTTFNMIEHMSDKPKEEEELTPFWASKKQVGIYKGDGMLEDKENIDNRGGEWLEY